MAAARPRKAAARKPAKAAKPKPGKPARPAKASPSKPARKPAKPRAPAKPAKAPRQAASRRPAPPVAEAGWLPVEPQTADEESWPEAEAGAVAPPSPAPDVPPPLDAGWAPLPDPTPAPVLPAPQRAQPRPFDPATGAWLPAGSAPASAPAPAGAPAAEPAPEAAKKSPGATFWTVLLAIDLGFLALNFLAQLVVGAIFLFAPDSSTAESLRDQFGVASPGALAVQQALTFVLMGVVPFLWVLGTRRVTWEGTKRYLRLHEPARGILRGIALTPLLLVAVMLLITVYTVATQGADALSLTESEEGQNPAVDAILEQLTWPVALLIALTAGVGEEILFRGVLQRWVGLWGQAVLFGLAHAAGGFLPQILFAAGLGVFFGYLVRRGWSLWTLMTAHFLYDLTLLGIALVYG